jgi:serine phosphatase RsbU (regulator of sigma subunit)
VSKDTTLYLSSDGYWDQIGGEKLLPFGKKRFKKLLNEVYKESMADQQEAFLYTLEDYQADVKRNDDITVIGLKI